MFAFGADGDVAERGGPLLRAVAPIAASADGEVGDEPAAEGPRVTARARRTRGPPVDAGGSGSVGMPSRPCASVPGLLGRGAMKGAPSDRWGQP